MDHVPYPENLALPLMEIDYLCCDIEAYDGLGFLDYPTRRGWTQTAGSSQWINCSSQIAAKRAQNWLYFGFLHEIFGSDYSLENFLRPNPNKAGFLVSTRQLPELLSRFNSRSLYQRLTPIFGLNRSVNLDFVDRSRPLCLEVNLQSDLLDRLSEDCRPITLSIKVLLESIQTAICNIERDEGQSIMVTNRVFPTRLTYSRMVEAGWCPKQAAHLASYSVIGAHYLAAIQRKSFGSDHGKCKGSVCVANNVDEKQYKVAHIEDHCQCQFYGPESAKVIKIMKDGNIPLISITVTVDGDPRLQVLEASPGLRYTAISHVWIGGLGNFFENQLPRCQLLQIRSLLKNLKSYKPQHGKSHTVAKPTRLFTAGARIMKILISYLSCLCLYQRNDFGIGDLELSSLEEIDPVVFWMDTLCIPVGDENALLRADAINKMDLIYAGARDVLVLDPELQQIPLEGLPQEEISAHILCSPWMTRCWTLQEARLSSNWYAQFADGIFDPRSAHSRLIKDIVSFFGFNNVYDDLRGLKHEMFNEWYYRQLPKRNTSELGLTLVIDDVFSFEWNNLVQRSTTKKEDVHCILANMLGLSAGEVLALHYEERMKAILCTQAMLPLGLLFNEGPRVQDVDNGWVPLYPEEVLDSKLGNMKVTANGLLFDHSLGRCEGFAVSSSVPPPAKVCLCDTSNSNSELLWATPVANDPSQGFDVPIRIATCYILGGDGKSKLAQRDRVGRALIGARVGARFALQRSEGRILHLVYEHPVKFRYSAKDYDANNGLIEDGSSWPRANTEKLPTDQVYQLGCDIASWPRLKNRREVIEQMKFYDLHIVGFYLVAVALCAWLPFWILSGVSIGKIGLFVTLIGPLSIAVIRAMCGWAEYHRLKSFLEVRAHDLYVRSYDNGPIDVNPRLSDHKNTKRFNTKSSLFLQFAIWQLSLAMAAATVLIIVGVKFQRQEWALWIGLAIPTELAVRLAMEILWQRTKLGRWAPSWLAKQSWWNDEVQLQHF